MRIFVPALIISASLALASGDPSDHVWFTGKIVDENRARYLATIYHNGHSSTNTSGSVSAHGQSTTIGDDTNTNINGSNSGTSSTDYSGSDMPLYKVYENLIIEGDDRVYVTQERIRWRWSKAAHVTVNGGVKYYVEKRKLHVLDDDGKEFLNFAQDGAQRMHKLVKDLLAFSRLEYSNDPKEHFNGTKMLEEALQNLQVAIEESE